MSTQSQGAPALIEASRDIFGAHPEDVISPIRSAADVLMWLEEIFKTISDEAIGGNNRDRIHKLAEAGAYLAFDGGAYAEDMHESMLARLQGSGVAPVTEARHV